MHGRQPSRSASEHAQLERPPARCYSTRGFLFIGPGEKVYPGMIIGEHSRPSDLDVNPLKAKQLTNIRAAGKNAAVLLSRLRA